MTKVHRLPSADLIGSEILNMHIGYRLLADYNKISVVIANSALESANYNTDSNADPPKIGLCVRGYREVFIEL